MAFAPIARNPQHITGSQISVTALEAPPNLTREMFDISIFLKEATGHRTEKVLEKDVIYPVCTPDIASRLKAPADLLNETSLYDALWAGDWQHWLDQAVPGQIKPQNGPRFSLYSIAVEEVKNGAGVLIGHGILIQPLLNSGALVAPFKQTTQTGKSLILEFASNALTSSRLKQVATMLGNNTATHHSFAPNGGSTDVA